VLAGCSTSEPDQQPRATDHPATPTDRHPTTTSTAPSGPILTKRAVADIYRSFLGSELQATLDLGDATIAEPRVLADCTRTAREMVAANQEFSGNLRAYRWPADVQPQIDELIRILAADQRPLEAMAAATTQSTFDSALETYFTAGVRRGATLALIRRGTRAGCHRHRFVTTRGCPGTPSADPRGLLARYPQTFTPPAPGPPAPGAVDQRRPAGGNGGSSALIMSAAAGAAGRQRGPRG
jgi:hypothetical protein